MNTFLRPVKQRLKNAQHYALMEAFKTVAEAAGFTGTKLQALMTAFVTCFTEEDRCYMLARASETIRRRDEADKLRDRLYSKLHQLVKVWVNSGNTALQEAAEALIVIFDLYKVKTNGQIDEETGQLDNLITDLSTTAMLAHITTIGGMWLFEQMVAANNQVKAIRLEQGTEMSDKVKGALDKARHACDAAYDDVIAMIEALALTADDTSAYEAFIHQWNGTLKIYQDILDRKSGNSTAGDANEGGGSNGNNGNTGNTGTDEPGGSGNSGGNQGGSTGGDSGGNSGGDNGGNSGGGDNSGGNSGGGGDDWGNGSDE